MHCNNPELYPSATGQHAGQPRYGHLIGNRWGDSTGTPLPVNAPALALGNAAVLKPTEEACLICMELGSQAVEAGFPAGVLNTVALANGTEIGLVAGVWSESLPVKPYFPSFELDPT